MSSMLRNLQRKALRRSPDYVTPSQGFRLHKDGTGYDVLHPTRGWKRVCAKRAAQH